MIGVIDAIRRHHLARGTRWAELSWILEDNWPMRRVAERLGGRPYKIYRVYTKRLS